MRIAIYRNTMNPKGRADGRKMAVLDHFAQGVVQAGDQVIQHSKDTLIDTDVAVMVGWVHEGSKNSPHLRLRRSVIDHQLSRNRYVVVADSNLFLYADQANPHYYLRYSLNGVFPNTGIYCDDRIDATRWPELCRNMGITMQPWRQQGSHILLCLQRNGGWSMGNYDVMRWCSDTIAQIRRHSQRPIRLRAHPGDKGAAVYLNPNNDNYVLKGFPGISVSPAGRSLMEDLKDCWCVVNHNSSPAVGAAIEGIPVFVTDPQRSQARDIANVDLACIENPSMPDRTHWLNRLAQFHWNFADVASGRAWRHMRQWTKQ